MKSETENWLNSIIKNHEIAIENGKKQKENALTAEKLFLEEFYKLRENVINPAMDEISINLKQNGYDCEIKYYDYQPVPEGEKRIDAGIQFLFYLRKENNYRYKSNIPFVSFVAELQRKNVMIYVSTIAPMKGGSAGCRRNLLLKEISKDLVQDEIIKMIEEVIN